MKKVIWISLAMLAFQSVAIYPAIEGHQENQNIPRNPCEANEELLYMNIGEPDIVIWPLKSACFKRGGYWPIRVCNPEYIHCAEGRTFATLYRSFGQLVGCGCVSKID